MTALSIKLNDQPVEVHVGESSAAAAAVAALASAAATSAAQAAASEAAVEAISATAGVSSFNTRYGAVTLTNADVLGALGTLGVPNGGIGATSLTSGYLLKGNGTSAVSGSVVYDDGTNVGIGTSSPSTVGGGGKLVIAGNLAFDQNRTITFNGAGQSLITNPADAGVVTVNAGTTSGYVSAINIYGGASGAPNVINFATASAERARIDSSGSLLVGTTNTGYSNTNSILWDAPGKYQIINHSGTSSGAGYILFAYNGGGIGSISQDGTTGVLYNTSSDARLKENIADAATASNLIDAIKVRQFDWKADGSHQRYGFIAQELLPVAPEAVSVPSDPDQMMGVDYSKLVPMLVKELQSVRARLAILEGN